MNCTLIILITFNGEHWIRACLSSIYKDSQDSDIICIDNGSFDNTLKIIKEEFHSVILIENKINLGFGKANNIGFEYALKNNYKYVFLLNQDTWVDENAIFKLKDTFEKNQVKGILSPIHLDPNSRNLDFNFEFGLRSQTTTRFISDYFFNKPFLETPYKVGFINAAAWFLSVDMVKEIGGFSPTFFHYGEDNNYGHRLMYNGYEFFIDPSVRIYHDCPQYSRRSYLGIKKIALREYSEYLIILSNPKYSFQYNLRESFLKHLAESVRALAPFRFKFISIQMLISFYIVRDFWKIYKNYKKQKFQAAFLNI